MREAPAFYDGRAITLDVFSVKTTTPNALVATINHERMPALLASEDDHEAWVNGSAKTKPFFAST
jgi:putative SOS response-associated peptidase YedK